jgi:hypothetical protein
MCRIHSLLLRDNEDTVAVSAGVISEGPSSFIKHRAKTKFVSLRMANRRVLWIFTYMQGSRETRVANVSRMSVIISRLKVVVLCRETGRVERYREKERESERASERERERERARE